ncbi:MAG: methyltransferase domain-containing protein [Parachlamydiaceae bacterium]|nr:methyltransferase domain-containing protein [Parachlamydiaceae bacterium]
MKSILALFTLLPILLFAKGIEDAKTYHANSELQWRVAMETIDLIPWKESDNILDIGCGDGKITAFLSKKAAKGSVLGVDISQAMIDFASSHYPQTDYANLTFQKKNTAEISFENQFDKIVSFSTLHWVLDQEKALKAIYRALAFGGKICIHTYGKGNMNVTDMGDSLIHTEKWIPYFPSYTKQRVFFTEQEYHSLLEQAGFLGVQTIGFWSNTSFANRQALIDFAKPILNFIRHLPQELQQEFVEEVVDRIISIAGPSNDGAIHYQTFNIQAIGTK